MNIHQQRIRGGGGEFAKVAVAVQHPLETLYEDEILTYFCS
jgi:hypothetical protein